MPPLAASIRPILRASAPVKAPFSWPNSSEPIRPGGRAAQLSATNGPRARAERSWIARATSSLPVPLSPWIRTEASDRAILSMAALTARIAGLLPTIAVPRPGCARSWGAGRALDRDEALDVAERDEEPVQIERQGMVVVDQVALDQGGELSLRRIARFDQGDDAQAGLGRQQGLELRDRRLVPRDEPQQGGARVDAADQPDRLLDGGAGPHAKARGRQHGIEAGEVALGAEAQKEDIARRRQRMAGWQGRRLGLEVEIAHLRSGRVSFSGAARSPNGRAGRAPGAGLDLPHAASPRLPTDEPARAQGAQALGFALPTQAQPTPKTLR